MRYIMIIGLMAVAVASVAVIGEVPGDKLPVFDPEQQQGDVKVTLLQISRVTTFSRQFVHDPPENGVAAIPGIEMMYLVERLGDEPLGMLTLGGANCWIDGEPVRPIATVVGGGLGASSPWYESNDITDFDMPRAERPERARVIRSYSRGIIVDRDHVDLHIVVGFDGVRLFEFPRVPIN